VGRDIIDLYERHALDYDRDRGRGLQERDWLARFAAFVRPGGTVLDIGCGMAEPIARHLIEIGFQITGLDASPTMISLCRERLPGSEWLVADMRQLSLGRRFDGLLAWDSLFHLAGDEQAAMFPRFAEHAAPGAALMFTSGPSRGETIGSYHGEPLFHASLDPAEYARLLTSNGFSLRAHAADDPDCGHHTVWLASRRLEA
jgi:2-polyprenyl-3-methyl-5-hydroxy-6-metoxy-1,4-benzoquinol methylase